MTGLLASVRNLEEAELAAGAAVDIIDLKAPEHGALGALPVEVVAAIVRRFGASHTLSATIGDLALDPPRVAAAVRTMATSGVDYVKMGFFPGGDIEGTLAALRPLTRAGIQIVAVLFGDRNPDPALAAPLAAAGFAGCMLDTADKRSGSLPRICQRERLADFVAEVRRQGLLCGLAGSLTIADVPTLLPLEPDYLGFRGALCRNHQRIDRLDPDLLDRVARAVHGAVEVLARPPRPSRPARSASLETQPT